MDITPLTPPSKVPKETLERALSSLLKWHSSKSDTQKLQLLPSDEFLYLVLTLHKIPSKGRTNPFKIPLPNPLFSSDASEICLILDDSHIPSKSAKQKVLDEQIPVSKILKFSKLKTDYKPFEAKRKLCDSFDLFFADKRIIPLLPRFIGKHFYMKKKIPLPIELGRKNWKEQINRGCSSALLYLSTGSCCVVKVGKVSMSKDEMLENLVSVIDGIAAFVPKKWSNVRSIHLKLPGSVALPVYQTLPEMKMKISGVVVGNENVGSDDLNEESVKKSESMKVTKKRGRIHEVRYMDSVGFGDMIGDDESGSDDDDDDGDEDGELGSDEIVGMKRKNGDAEKKKVNKVAKVNKGDKGLKKKKAKVLGESKIEKKSKKIKAF